MQKNFFSKLKKPAKILVLTHAGCDVDALASAAALYFSLNKKFSVTIGIPEHLNIYAKALAANLKIPFTINPENLEKFDALVLVDFNSFKMLGSMEQKVRAFKRPILLLDHHSKSTDKITKNAIIKPERISTTELVFGLLKQNKIPLTAKAAECIAAGIVTDSANFLVADAETFSIMSEALKIAKNPYQEIVFSFQVEEDFSEKIAKLKAAKRVRIFKVGDYIIATTRVGCFEADAATALVRLGADVAFAGDVDCGKLRVSGRAKPSFIKKTGFDLPRNVFEPLEKSFSGSGGGHAGAAAFNGTAEEIEQVLQKCLEFCQSFIKEKTGSSETKEFE